MTERMTSDEKRAIGKAYLEHIAKFVARSKIDMIERSLRYDRDKRIREITDETEREIEKRTERELVTTRTFLRTLKKDEIDKICKESDENDKISGQSFLHSMSKHTE